MSRSIFCPQRVESVKVDKIDLKILQVLGVNSRVSLKKLGRVVGRSKEGVRARILSLEKRGIILTYSAILDFKKVGVKRYIFRIFLKGGVLEKKEYIERILGHEDVISVMEVAGELQILFFIRDRGYLDKACSFVLNSGDVRSFSYSELVEHYYKSPLLFGLGQDKKIKKIVSSRVEIVGGKKIKLDKLDFSILRLLMENSRLKISGICERLGEGILRDSIKYRIKRMKENGVIRDFICYYDIHKLGYMTYTLNVALCNRGQKGVVLDFLRGHRMTNGVVEFDGVWDVYCVFYCRDMKEVMEFEGEFLKRFSGDVFDYSVRDFREQVFVRGFPEFL